MLKFSLRAGAAVALVAATAVLSACAPIQPNQVTVGRAKLQLPPGNWETLDTGDSDTFNVLPDDVSHDLPMRTQAVGLRGPQQEMLAVIMVQTNATNDPRNTTLWTHTCAKQRGVEVTDFASGSPTRIDCLRYKRRADADEYLPKHRSALFDWMKLRGAEPLKPYSLVSYRFATAEGGYLLVDALIDQRVLRPRTVGNEEFLHAGQPAQKWLDDFVNSARASLAMLDGSLVVPPFPVALEK